MNINKIKALFDTSKDKYADARLMGTTYQNLTQLFRNGGDLKVSTLEGIAKFYNVPVGYFFDEADKNGKPTVQKSDRRSAKDLEIERLKGQIKGMQEAIDRLGFSLRNVIIDDN